MKSRIGYIQKNLAALKVYKDTLACVTVLGKLIIPGGCEQVQAKINHFLTYKGELNGKFSIWIKNHTVL
ncbi:hypothetical protein IJ00_21215 [Calothrix sp. 336/3]|nr:hypothetical protein IJ00_21215 [Calothrix sp. 336/3]